MTQPPRVVNRTKDLRWNCRPVIVLRDWTPSKVLIKLFAVCFLLSNAVGEMNFQSPLLFQWFMTLFARAGGFQVAILTHQKKHSLSCLLICPLKAKAFHCLMGERWVRWMSFIVKISVCWTYAPLDIIVFGCLHLVVIYHKQVSLNAINKVKYLIVFSSLFSSIN